MPRTAKPPAYRLYRRTGQAVVTLNGRDHYLGPHGTKTSRDAYDRLVGEWLANGRRMPADADDGSLTITEFVAAYWKHALAYYARDGRPTDEVGKIKNAVRPLKRLHGPIPVSEFGPLRLKVVRQAFIDAGNCRREVNAQVGRIRRAFKWGVENEIVPADVLHALQAVAGLKRGRTEARETAPIKPAPDEHVDAVRPYVSRQVWAIVELQRLTGMRPGEVVIMRGRDLDMTGKLWVYRPASHKTQHHGHERVVEIGPRTQEIIRPFLKADVEGHLFSPADAVAERAAAVATHRRPGQAPTLRKTKRTIRDHFDRDSYRRAIDRACKLADVPHWHPHQLRHNYATMIRKEYGIETARILLGHRSVVVTEIYAEADRMKAREIVGKIG